MFFDSARRVLSRTRHAFRTGGYWHSLSFGLGCVWGSDLFVDVAENGRP